MGGITNAASVIALTVIGLAFAQNVVAGTGREWLAAKFLNRGARPLSAPGTTAENTAAGAGIGQGPSVAGSARLGDPLPGGRVISVWGDPRDGGRRVHKGIDIAAPRGSALLAVGNGTVARAGNAGGLCGKRVAIRLGNGTEAIYCHLSAVAVSAGQNVRRGQVIGYVGNTGNAATTPPHVHFEIRRNGQPVNPAPIIGR